eukprot:Gb_19612 [translate_table: standard]
MIIASYLCSSCSLESNHGKQCIHLDPTDDWTCQGWCSMEAPDKIDEWIWGIGRLVSPAGILNKMSPQTFDTQVDRLLASGIDSADILEGMASIVYYKTISEPKFFPMYAKMCVHLIRVAPQIPSDKPDGKSASFRRKLVNLCQKEFEGAYKWNGGIEPQTTPQRETDSDANLRSLGNIRLIGELFKQNMLPQIVVHKCIQELLRRDENTTLPGKNVEALCVLFKTVGKQLEESTNSGMIIDKYFVRLKELSTSPNLVWRIRFMVRDVLDLRQNKWIPREEEVNDIDVEMERKLSLRPSKANIRKGHRSTGSGHNFSLHRPRGIMLGMPAGRFVRRSEFGPSIRSDFISGIRSEGRLPSGAGLIQGQERPPMILPRPPVINPNLLPRGASDLRLLTYVTEVVKMVQMRRTTFEAALKTIEFGSDAERLLGDQRAHLMESQKLIITRNTTLF